MIDQKDINNYYNKERGRRSFIGKKRMDDKAQFSRIGIRNEKGIKKKKEEENKKEKEGQEEGGNDEEIEQLLALGEAQLEEDEADQEFM